MPRLSQLMIRTALVWLALGYTVGGLMLFNKGIPLLGWFWTLRFPHVHMLLIGWTVQFACGVAFWIMPRLDAQDSRGNEQLVWLCYGALNSGVVIAAFHDPLVGALPHLDSSLVRAMPVIAGGCYMIAISAFFGHLWRRILPFRTLPRPSPDSSADATQTSRTQ